MSLQKIQSELKAPKSQRNDFGKYNYRSAEDIIEAVKPILEKYEYSLLTPQTIIEVAGRVYVETVATIVGPEGIVASATAQAREAESRKGMDESQITGATGSYSKKYALNNLFAIDDTKDADATNDHSSGKPQKKAEPIVIPERKCTKDEIETLETSAKNPVFTKDERDKVKEFVLEAHKPLAIEVTIYRMKQMIINRNKQIGA